jgi:F0F1-type ATP synthase membrane subunit b/b'
VSPLWTTFLFEAVNFVLLAVALGWLLFRPIRSVLAARQAALVQETEEVAAKRAEVERLQEAMQQRSATLDTELEHLRQSVLTAAQQEAERIRAEARVDAEREREAMRHRLAHLEEAQLEHLAAAVATAAGAAVQRLLQQLGGPDLEQGLARAACRTLQTLHGEALGAVTVESAHPLDQETMTTLTTVLGDAARTAVFRVTPTLGTGIRISTSHGLVDASAAGLAAFAQRTLTAQLGGQQHGLGSAPAPMPEEISHHG